MREEIADEKTEKKEFTDRDLIDLMKYITDKYGDRIRVIQGSIPHSKGLQRVYDGSIKFVFR
jgi:hypothetical protein